MLLPLVALLILPAAAASPHDEIASAIRAAEDAMLVHNDQTAHMEEAMLRFSDMLDDATDMEDGQDANVASITEKMEQLIRQTNILQLEQFTADLSAALEAEITSRHATPPPPRTVTQKQKQQQQQTEKIITQEDLEKIFNAEELLEETERELEGWIGALLNQQAGEATSKLVEAASIAAASSQDMAVTEEDSDDENCVSAEKGANEVRDALVRFANDGIGLKDHAQGSEIVYDMSSKTYTPPPLDNDRLGHGKWRRFVPDDIEDLLPEGWHDWDIRLPRNVYHVLGVDGAGTASHHTFLHPDTQPGSCWPFAGNHGHVTFQLPYAVNVEAVTVDHVPSQLLMEGQDQSSAPKTIKVYGMPSCKDGCNGHSFDKNAMFLLGEVAYDIEKGISTQTFPIGNKEDKKEGLSCSAATASCSAPGANQEAVAAIRLEVLSNWGNELYTCLYRFRVHGQPAES